MLYCVECWCCSDLGNGWVAMRCDEPDPETGDPVRDVALYSPPCAASEFGYRPEAAANHVCVWEPIVEPSERRDV